MPNILHLILSSLQHSLALVFRFLTLNPFQQPHNPLPSSLKMKHIVILGGSYGGISTAHRLLKQSSKLGLFKITLISPNTHFYWSMASPRGLIPGALTDDEIFRPIVTGFSKYPSGQFEFVAASATSLDTDKKKVGIESNGGEKSDVAYDYLVIATGAKAKGAMNVPFKEMGSTEETKKKRKEAMEGVENADRIVIAGASFTGVETAGELGWVYGRERKKEIILISSTPHVLSTSPPTVSKLAQQYLQDLNIALKLSTKVLSSTLLPDAHTELILSDGSTLTTDVYIQAFGLTPNTSFLPSKFTAGNSAVIVDEHLKVKGAGAVWAIGDVSDAEPPSSSMQFLAVDRQSAYLAKHIVAILSGKAYAAYKPTTLPHGVLIGKNAGTGHFGSWRLPKFAILFSRKELFLQNMGGTLDGSLF